MSIRTSLVLAAGVVVGPTTAASQSLTLEQVVTAAPITGSVPAALAWSPDGRTLAFTWDSTGGPSRRVWLVGHDATRRRALRATPAPVRELVWHPAGRMLVALQGDQLVAIDVATGVVRVLVERAPGAGTLTLSPDGTQAAWLADGDLFVAPLPSPASDAPTATGRRVTEVGIPSLSQVGLGTYARRDRRGPRMGRRSSRTWWIVARCGACRFRTTWATRRRRTSSAARIRETRTNRASWCGSMSRVAG